ncbi:stress-responsive transcriptional regulator [Pediococcus acidilactici]|nr:stress-responsive transcriptional regulator [Pediococcus acidilactici]
MKSGFKSKFTKSNDRFVAGVCGGIAEHFGWDKSLTRIIALVLILLSHGLLLIPYFILAWYMPSQNTGFFQQFCQLDWLFGKNSRTKAITAKKRNKDAEVHDAMNKRLGECKCAFGNEY